jgi:hypothetical protein
MTSGNASGWPALLLFLCSGSVAKLHGQGEGNDEVDQREGEGGAGNSGQLAGLR